MSSNRLQNNTLVPAVRPKAPLGQDTTSCNREGTESLTTASPLQHKEHKGLLKTAPVLLQQLPTDQTLHELLHTHA